MNDWNRRVKNRQPQSFSHQILKVFTTENQHQCGEWKRWMREWTSLKRSLHRIVILWNFINVAQYFRDLKLYNIQHLLSLDHQFGGNYFWSIVPQLHQVFKKKCFSSKKYIRVCLCSSSRGGSVRLRTFGIRRWCTVNICQPCPYHPRLPLPSHHASVVVSLGLSLLLLLLLPLLGRSHHAVLPKASTVPSDGPACDKHVWWVCVTCHVCIWDFGVCVCVCICAWHKCGGLPCYQIDMSVCEALLFSDVPHTGSWSLCVCDCVCLCVCLCLCVRACLPACLPSSALLETDGPWHLPFGRFSLWKMSSSSDPTCMCVCVCVCVCVWKRGREGASLNLFPWGQALQLTEQWSQAVWAAGTEELVCLCVCVCVIKNVFWAGNGWHHS